MRTKSFDCIESKRAAQRQIRAQVAGVTPAQEIDFFRAGHEEFARALPAARPRDPAAPRSSTEPPAGSDSRAQTPRRDYGPVTD